MRMSRAAWAKKWKPYKSKLEHDFAQSLKDNNIEFRYEGEILQYRKRVVGGICDSCGHDKTSQRRKYLPDFIIGAGKPDERGRVEGSYYIETKGNFTPADRAKMLAVAKDNPELDIRLVFSQNNKLQKKKDERYSDWAEKHSFPYHVGADYPARWSTAKARAPGDTSKRKRRKRKASGGRPLQEAKAAAD